MSHAESQNQKAIPNQTAKQKESPKSEVEKQSKVQKLQVKNRKQNPKSKVGVHKTGQTRRSSR